jgi:uncharacterized protein YgiM (DUF1202 family)
MQKDNLRRIGAGAAIVALAAAIAGCAGNSQQPPSGAGYPRPATMTPPPAYGSTQPAPSPSAPAADYAVTAPLHLRTGPGVNSSIIATLPPGMQVLATGSQQGAWWEVQTPEGTGWVSSRFLAPG